jgi:ATP-dependent DNA helicase RecG
MSSAYDKLRRILILEKDQGYRDRAVIGGLARFLGYWQKEARREAQQYVPPIDVEEVLRSTNGYSMLSPQERRPIVEQLLHALSDGASEPAVQHAPPPPAPVAPSLQDAIQAPGEQPAPTDTEPPVVRKPTPKSVTRPVEHKAANSAASQSTAEEPRPVKRTRRLASDRQISLSDSVTALKGVSTVSEEKLARLGIATIRDLIYHFPRRYDDYGQLKTINRLALGDEVTVAGVIRETKTRRTRSGALVVSTVITDGTGAIEARWFGQPHLQARLKAGRELVVSGKVTDYLGRLYFDNPEWEPLQRLLLHTARLVPVYALTEGVKARWLRRLMRTTLDYWVPRIIDPMPPAILQEEGLLGLGAALEQIHFPDSHEMLTKARERLCFDEFLLLQLGILRHRKEWRGRDGKALPIPHEDVEAFISRLPFALTNAQRRAIDEILRDMEQPTPMSRLLQGDVGSGKTVVAVAAILAAVRNGLQAAVMAPTSILAEQHYHTISRLLEPWPEIGCELLVGSLSEGEKRELQEAVAAGEVQVVVGTHALIQERVEFDRLGLVVVDEQHRFGVSQRGSLRAKGSEFQPHLLAMSATPIPRTLALTIYGDLDLSVLDEMPPNRQRVLTAIRDRHSRERIYSFIEGQVQQGRQAFIICPLVEESDKIDSKAAISEYQRLQADIFPNLRLGLLHGRMSPQEKEQVMADFKARQFDILVSTAVVEVGIDIPNATVMLIEGAESFGLAQLHQFRGRVGRGEHKSYCILLSDNPNDQVLERLEIMEQTSDGFVLAEKDLELRGPGDFFGVRQHGLPELKVASLSDTAILTRARAQALRLFEQDPDLALPEHELLATSVQRFWITEELA